MARANLPATIRKRLDEIDSRTWEHSADRAALTALRTVPGLDLVLKKILGALKPVVHGLGHVEEVFGAVNDSPFGIQSQVALKRNDRRGFRNAACDTSTLSCR